MAYRSRRRSMVAAGVHTVANVVLFARGVLVGDSNAL